MEPWIPDGAHSLKSLGLFCKYRGTANLIQGKTKSSDLSVRYVAPRVGNKLCISSDKKQFFYLGGDIGDVKQGLNSGNLDIGDGGNE